MRKSLLLALVFMIIGLHAQEFKPTLTQSVLRVKVLDDKKISQAGKAIGFISLKDGKEFNGTTDAEGKFTILIPPAQKYKVKYKIFATVREDLILELPVS